MVCQEMVWMSIVHEFRWSFLTIDGPFFLFVLTYFQSLHKMLLSIEAAPQIHHGINGIQTHSSPILEALVEEDMMNDRL